MLEEVSPGSKRLAGSISTCIQVPGWQTPPLHAGRGLGGLPTISTDPTWLAPLPAVLPAVCGRPGHPGHPGKRQDHHPRRLVDHTNTTAIHHHHRTPSNSAQTKSCLIHREVGGTAILASAPGPLRDPDAILVGNCATSKPPSSRSPCRTGHISSRRFTQLAPKTVDRVSTSSRRPASPDPGMFSESLVGIVSGALKTKDGQTGSAPRSRWPFHCHNIIREKTAQISPVRPVPARCRHESVLKRLVMEGLVHADEAATKTSSGDLGPYRRRPASASGPGGMGGPTGWWRCRGASCVARIQPPC
jgi:hypothetical protein